MMKPLCHSAILPILFAAMAWPAGAELPPHVQKLAPGVYAGGFAHKYGSANCGWVAMHDHTLLVDLPRGIDIPKFLAEAAKTTGKPVRSVVLTSTQEGDAAILDALAKQGVKRVEPSGGVRIAIGDADVPVDFLPYGSVTGKSSGAALYLWAQKVLFAGPAVVNGPRANLAGSNTSEWVSVVERLKKLQVSTVVPGFGSWAGAEILDRQRKFLEELRRQVAYGITMGRPLEAIQKEFLLPASYYTWMPYDTPRPEDIAHVYGELTVPAAPYYERRPEKSAARPNALVLIGDRYHEPEHIEAGLRPVFEATGVKPHFTVDVRALTAQNLAPVELLVILRDGMLWPEGPGGQRQIWMMPEQERAVVNFVEGGGAFLNLHNSMGIYPENGPYLNLVGGRYIGHGPLERFRVTVVDRDHAITKGVGDYFAADEQHTPPYDKGKVHLLLENRSDEGKAAAAGWAYEPGSGRLCHLASGHTRESLEHPMFQRLMRNAVNWLLRR